MNETNSIQNEKIIQKMKQDGLSNTIIEYHEFLELYEKYGKNIMSELEFAYLLGMNYEKFRSMRTKGTKTMVLVNKASSELKKQIINDLSERGYTNKKIDYEEFLKLYSKYASEIIEKEFAEIIGLTRGMYQNIKNRGSKTIILKTKIDHETIKSKISDLYGKGVLIDYQQFQEIYKPYKSIINSEIKFAEIIGIASSSYYHFRKGGKVRILKDDEVSDELKNKIQLFILENNYDHKLIDYNEFLSLYKPFSELLEEKKFAKTIGISGDSHRRIKYQNSRTYIYIKETKKVSSIRIKEIKEELISLGYANKSVKYDSFLNIYIPYKNEMSEAEFADILGITYINYMTIKNQGSGAIILKTEKPAEEVIEKIVHDERIKRVIGKLIDYSAFKRLYEPYSNYITEIQFAEIIGLNYTKYKNLSKDKNRSRVENKENIRLRIRYLFKDSTIYTKKQILKLCNEYQCSLNEILKIVLKTNNEKVIEKYMYIIENQGKVYIGRCQIDKKYIKKYGEEIIRYINNVGEVLGKAYKDNRFCNDIVSDTIVYIFEERGDIFINHEKKEALKIIKILAKKTLEKKYMMHNKPKNNNYSLDEFSENYGDIRNINSDKNEDTEIVAIDELEYDELTERCITSIIYYYKLGLSLDEITKKAEKELNIDKKMLLEIMKKCLIKLNNNNHNNQKTLTKSSW